MALTDALLSDMHAHVPRTDTLLGDIHSPVQRTDIPIVTKSAVPIRD